MDSMTWWEYVQDASGGATNTAIAQRLGITHSAVGRWKESRPDPERVQAFAEAYDCNVLEAFVRAGYLTAEQAGLPPASVPDPKKLDDEVLIAEIRRRFQEGGSDVRQAEAEKTILMDGGADGESERGGRPTSSRQRKRGVTLHGRAPRNEDDP